MVVLYKDNELITVKHTDTWDESLGVKVGDIFKVAGNVYSNEELAICSPVKSECTKHTKAFNIDQIKAYTPQ